MSKRTSHRRSQRFLCTLAISLSLFGGAGCGVLGAVAGGGTVSCNTPSVFECQDDVGQSALTIATRQSDCSTVNAGVYSSSPCVRTGSIGGCKVDESAIMAGASIITWYFPGAPGSKKKLMTAADVMAECPTTYLAP